MITLITPRYNDIKIHKLIQIVNTLCNKKNKRNRTKTSWSSLLLFILELVRFDWRYTFAISSAFVFGLTAAVQTWRQLAHHCGDRRVERKICLHLLDLLKLLWESESVIQCVLVTQCNHACVGRFVRNWQMNFNFSWLMSWNTIRTLTLRSAMTNEVLKCDWWSAYEGL